MRPNPLTDFATVLTQPGWTTYVFWLLLAGSVAIAVFAARRVAGQLTARHAGIALLRLTMGVMWWEQSLWKQPRIPPNYDGLIYWSKQMVDHAAIPLHGDLVRDILLPNILVFGPFVYAVEVAIGVSLMFGFATRVGAFVGLGMAVNLWLGLYSAPGEWPWTYGYLVVIQALFLIDPPGRSLGIDALRGRAGWFG